MNSEIPKHLGIVAGSGVYPLLLAESARKQGVERISAFAFRRETDRSIERLVDDTTWVTLGKLAEVRDAIVNSGARQIVMAGQLTPTSLFNMRMDKALFDMLKKLPLRNAETIFGACADILGTYGIEVLPASLFMEAHMPEAGTLSARAPTEREQQDIALGLKVAQATSGLDVGQTVVIKEGTILAVEAFEGTDATILRAGRLGKAGAVVVKVAKEGHDMRFDIPVIGLRTMHTLKKARVSALAVMARRAILLERERIVAEADRLNIALVAT